jgi:N-acetylmuramoyl-L-alanine amidase
MRDKELKGRYGLARPELAATLTLGVIMIAIVRARTAFLVMLAMPWFAAGPRAHSQEPAIQAAKPQPTACQRAEFRVVLDVGHTVKVPGATSARGVVEYTFNLRLAEAAKQALLDAGFAKTVLLITSTAPTLGLFERARRANAMRANLFIALHHDSVPDYLLQTWQYQGQQEHYNDSFPGYAIFISNENGDRSGSLLFGKLLGEQLQARGLGYTPHYTLPMMRNRRRELVDADAGVYRYDQLVVLQQTHMPAVLLEAGSIVNRREELVLASPQRVALESAAIAAAVADFCADRAAPVRASHGSARHGKRHSVSAAAGLAHRSDGIGSVR